MIKQTFILLLFIFTLSTSITKAQEGREWIVSGQPYYKIPVAEEAVYQMTFADLNSKGISTSDPDKLQIWFRGVEQSIFINNNIVYFYGKGNDGTLDSLLYQPYSAQSNKYYSLFSDTTYYFLTVGTGNGKRLALNSAAAATLQANHRAVETIFYATDYYAGKLYNSDTHLSIGDIGEGWFGPTIAQSGTDPEVQNIDIPISNLYAGGSDPELEIMLIGANQNPHVVDIVINNSLVYSLPIFYERNVYKFVQTIPLSSLTNNQPLRVTVKVKGLEDQQDYVAVSYVILKYPQTTNLGGKGFYKLTPLADNTAKTLSLTGFTNGSLLWDISSEGAYVNLNYTYSAGTATANLLAGSSKILYANTFKNVIGINAVDMTPYPIGTAKMLLISHTKLITASNSAVLKYAAYKESIAGGAISVAVTDVNKLYNLYSYGEKHPIAIKRYCKEEINNGTAQDLFLVGKGINYDYIGTTDQGDFYYRKNPTAFINNTHTYQQLNYRMEDLIPPYGWPASDLYYSITDLTLRPKLTTGRLSARTDADVSQYLDKVRAHDALDSNVIWRKHLIHLSGGKNSSEVTYFRSVVDGFKAIVEGPRFGGHVVRTYTKNLTAGAVDSKLIYSVADEVNNGVSYITFFGHSSPSIIDLDIGNVSNPVYGYNNVGKYPLLMMNGCQSAEFFIMGSIPEDWIMTPKKGALLTLGHGDIGYPQYMKTYSEYVYKLNFTDNRFLRSSIGDVQRKTIDSFLTTYQFDSNREIVIAQATQFVLQGDPTINLYKPQKTDYAIAGDAEAGEKKVFVQAIGTKPISAMSDAFNIAIPISNYGLSNPKNIQIKVKHTVTNNGTVTIDKVYPLQTVGPIGYVDTVLFNIPLKDPKFFGINKFVITIDPNDSIPEFNENNNVATLEYFVPLSSVACLYPAEYSVVHDQPVNFVAQAIDLFQDTKTYHLEIDTTHLFNSPIKIVQTISSGALVKYTQQSLLTNVLPSDSIVYYWRIRFDQLTPGEDTLWGESSFIYIKGSADGWSQSKHAQFDKDTYNRMNISAQGALSFNTNTAKLYVRTQGNDNTNIEVGYNNNTLLAFIPGGYNCGYSDGCMIIVFDAETVLPYLSDPSYVCGVYENPQVQRFGDMSSAFTQGQVEAFLKSVKKNDFVLFVSTGTTAANTWSSTLKGVFENEYGAQHIPDLGLQTPYILLSRHKSLTTPLKEIYGSNPSDVIVLDEDNLLKGTYKSGSITSTVIGPSTLWGTMYKTVKRTNNDFAELKVIRIDSLGKQVDTIGVALDGDVNLDSIGVDAKRFPYIRLLMNTSDTSDFTPAYLKKWQVIYTPVPEGTLDPYKAGITNYPSGTVDIGTVFNIPFSFENISDVKFPKPLQVVFYVKNEFGKSKRDTVTLEQGQLLDPGKSFTFNYTINTADFPGKNTFQAYVNPQFQPEVYYQNNFIVVNYNVLVDKIHPVIGAMFDGVHIFDGDLVSPSPLISVTLKDNNGLLAMGDSTMTITLFDPQGVATVIPPQTNSSYLISMWAQDPTDKTRFKVEFKNKNDFPDGKYKLVIQGKDASGNRSGNQSLEVNFTVINESTITNFYPYPNPFSTSCRFVFSLTGKTIPEDIKIQIMTVSGKVVREIFKNELGNIHVGDNITDYAWDGRDEFGDKLANGVYIYRVLIKNQNDNFQHRETSADKAFKKGYGKLYILR